MHDVFKAVTLSFLIAALFQAMSSGFAFLDIYALGNWDQAYGQEATFKLAVAALSLHASMLCVLVLVASAFAKKYIEKLDTKTLIITALWVSAPIALLSQISGYLESDISWSPYILLIFSTGWATLGMYYILWHLTTRPMVDPQS